MSGTFHAKEALTVLRGNLAPKGCVMNSASCDPKFRVYAGHVLVFDGWDDLEARIDRPDLGVTPDTILVLRSEWADASDGGRKGLSMPIPRKLLAQGVRDMLRITDGDCDDGGFGAIVHRIAPSACQRGPLSLVRDGDVIAVDTFVRSIRLEVSPAELDRRRNEAA